MTDFKKRIYPQNPLGIIALFVFFIEAISTISLKFVLAQGDDKLAEILIWFIVLFPTVIALLFFMLLWLRREVLYSPHDFKNDDSFVRLINKMETLEMRQEVVDFDIDTNIKDYLNILDRLIEKNDIVGAIRVARNLLKESRFESSTSVFQYMSEKVNATHPQYYRVLSNLSYSMIGMARFEEAKKWMKQVIEIRTPALAGAWHYAALAFSCYKLGQQIEYDQVMKTLCSHRDFNYNMDSFVYLYPEWKEEIYKCVVDVKEVITEA